MDLSSQRDADPSSYSIRFNTVIELVFYKEVGESAKTDNYCKFCHVKRQSTVGGCAVDVRVFLAVYELTLRACIWYQSQSFNIVDQRQIANICWQTILTWRNLLVDRYPVSSSAWSANALHAPPVKDCIAERKRPHTCMIETGVWDKDLKLCLANIDQTLGRSWTDNIILIFDVPVCMEGHFEDLRYRT